jgi:hypothetical protein
MSGGCGAPSDEYYSYYLKCTILMCFPAHTQWRGGGISGGCGAPSDECHRYYLKCII